MKSSLKVDYRSRYSGNLGDKEPIVRIDVEESEDPRDSLLAEIFNGEVPKVLVFKSFEEKIHGTTYLIAKKSRYEQVCDIGSQVYQVLLETVKDKTGLIYVTGSDFHWFERDLKEITRSKGLRRDELSQLPDREVMIQFVQDFLEFTKND